MIGWSRGIVARSVVVGVAAIVGLFGWPAVAGDVAGRWWAFALAVAVGELLTIRQVGGSPFRASAGVLAAFALLHAPAPVLLGTAAAGWTAAWAVRRVRALPVVQEAGLASLLLKAWALAGVEALGSDLVPLQLGQDLHAGGLLAVTATLVLAPAVGSAVTVGVQPDAHALSVFRHRVGSGWRGALALASSAALAALAYEVLGVVALVVMALPLLAVRAGLARHASIRTTYDQTVVAMGRMTELTGHVSRDHGLRVAAAAVAIARDLRLSEREVEVVERAAHLHEVGRIATDDADHAAHDRDVALAGAAIVREAGTMPAVARVIERVRESYRRPGSPGPDPAVALPSRIIRTACEFDRLAGGDRQVSVWEALDALHRSMAYDHDPEVVRALERLVGRGRAR